jgi:hypothetical protein
VIKQLFLAPEHKNSEKKFFLFIEHEVLFYETPFFHRARRNYVCGQSEEVSSSGGSSLEFWDFSAFFNGHEVLFYETTFSASVLEH